MIKLNFDGGTLHFSDAKRMCEWLNLQYISAGSVVTVKTPRGSELKVESYRPPNREVREKKFVEFRGNDTINGK